MIGGIVIGELSSGEAQAETVVRKRSCTSSKVKDCVNVEQRRWTGTLLFSYLSFYRTISLQTELFHQLTRNSIFSCIITA